LKRILLLVVVLILYGSFYPWQFHARDLPANPVWILLHSWPSVLGRFPDGDAVVNFAVYIPFGVFCFLAMKQSRPGVVRAIATLLASALLSASIEMAQLFAASRDCSLWDVACNVAGGAIGMLLGAAFPRAISGALQEAGAAVRFRRPEVEALLYLWAGYQLFPLFPELSGGALRVKLAALLSTASWPARDFFEGLAGWLAMAALIECRFGRERAPRVLGIALFAIPLKLLIAHRTATGSEAAGALAAMGAWAVFRRLARPMPAAGLLATAAIAAAGLVPFRWSAAPQPFTWIPFVPMLRSSWEPAFLILLRKSFLYGAAVWLLNENRRDPHQKWMSRALIVASMLAMVEAIQVHLPGRTPEVTDPLLALILGFSLMLLERRRTSSKR
jgi:VanZ family protein